VPHDRPAAGDRFDQARFAQCADRLGGGGHGDVPVTHDPPGGRRRLPLGQPAAPDVAGDLVGDAKV
jgi:hypothetical protein